MTAGELRKKYPAFIYRGYSYALKEGDLRVAFDFELGGIKFRSKVVIKNVSQRDLHRVGDETLQNLVFHLGLAEMPTYWKATASPHIIVEAGTINKAQINWWHDLFMKGMGEYFYKNKIDFRKKDFLEIKPSFSLGDSKTKAVVSYQKKLQNRMLLPIGGGKDAIVTYEILRRTGENVRPFVLNPKKEHNAILHVMGGKNPILVLRAIDPKLLELNRKGYLNGHTPFSAYLAFLTVLCSALFNYKYSALSNERSSNEGNVDYLGHTINHQYSKSWEFEKKFRAYSKKYLARDVEYFSFLRPLYELQIAQLFSQYHKYFATFLSCNEAHKTDSGTRKPIGKWCGKCSKCLFVFASLYPFVETRQLVGIFDKNLFEDASLLPLMEELLGEHKFKPFECVGTIKENLAAFYLSLRKTHPPLPILLKHFRQYIVKKHPALHTEGKTILASWNKNHFLPPQFERILSATR